MIKRPELNKELDSKTFRTFYYLKEELVNFCKDNNLPTSGSKIEITDRIASFLQTGQIPTVTTKKKKTPIITTIDENLPIEDNFVCSEKHRAFFKKHIGDGFSFNVAFQKWLKSNSGKTYKEAIAAYHQIIKDKQKGTTKIDSQFEYNTYIRDFFTHNKGKSLQDAIKCWTYKKSLQGHNRYEETDLVALNQ